MTFIGNLLWFVFGGIWLGLALFVVAHLFFRIAEHHVEEMSKDEEPEQKIERAKVTWR